MTETDRRGRHGRPGQPCPRRLGLTPARRPKPRGPALIVVCDTGPLVAAASCRDRHHRLCAGLLEEYREGGALIVPVTVSVEVDYLLREHVDVRAARRFLADLESGALLHEPVDDDVLHLSTQIDAAYGDADLGLVDASVVAIAERVGADVPFPLPADPRTPARAPTRRARPPAVVTRDLGDEQ